jgi:hypothetical protein
MARITKKVVVFKASTKGRSKEAARLMEDFKVGKRIRKGRLLPSPTMTFEERLFTPVIKRKKPAAKKKTTVKSVISPICRKAGRTLKATGSSAAGRTLGSKKCKTKKVSTTMTATRKKATATRKRATTSKGPLKSIMTSVSKLFSSPKKVVSKSSPTKRRATRTTSCVKKVAAIRKILK